MKNDNELYELRAQERKLMQELASRDCVGAHRDITYKALERVRGRIRYLWWERSASLGNNN